MRWFLSVLLTTAAVAGPSIHDPVAARAQRRAALARHLGRDYALVLGQPLTDVLQPRQEGHFLYVTGVEDPDASLLMAGAKARPLMLPARKRKVKTREVLFLRAANPRFARFYGLRYRPDAESAEKLGIQTARAAPRGGAGLARTLLPLLPKRARLHVPAYKGPDHGLVRAIRRDLVETLLKSRPDIQIVDLHAELSRLRSVKDKYELDALARAVDITLGAFRDTLPQIRPGSTEGAVDGALLQGVRRRGGRPAYTFVVAAGPNGTIPHYFRNEAPLRDGDLVVIDAGAAVDRYAADVTRTFPVSGVFSERQREVYGVVLRAQRAAIEVVRPGATLAHVDRAARSIVTEAGFGKDFIHFTSHHVGLDVHDRGIGPLAPGMTITVEPGIYLPDERFGIRIEDVVLVTEKGHEVLSSAFPRDPDAIEALLRQR